MTQAAAKMENNEEYKNFTDVMEYNPDTGNWYIPGLWHGNPPMAPVNAGYSETVHELKRNLVQVLGKCESGNNIMDFLEWTKSLWNAVKYENFIFSFRNSLVADAYMRLCTEFNTWDWSFRKHMYTWVTNAETRISNFETNTEECQKDMQDLLSNLKSEASSELSKWESRIIDNLTKYYEQPEGHVYLVEGFREDFSNSAKNLRREIENSVVNQLEANVEIRQGMSNLDTIKKNHTVIFEKKILALIEECSRGSKAHKSDAELDEEFDKIWEKTVRELSFKKSQPKDIVGKVSRELRSNLSQKGSSVNETVSHRPLDQCGQETFKVDPGSFRRKCLNKIQKLLGFDDHIKKTQTLADSIIDACHQFVFEKAQRKTDYHDNYIQEILRMIEARVADNRDLNTNVDFEVLLKLHICGFASREFLQMHKDFIQVNDPSRCLDQYKEKYRADFKDLFNKRDQCRKKAEEFTLQCLTPAVEAKVQNSLGPDIVDVMVTGKDGFQFSTRAFFQYSVLKQLLSEFTFESYISYISNCEQFVKKWIVDQIKQRFSNGSKMFELEEKHLKANIKKITEAITKAQTDKSNNLEKFVQNICKELRSTLVIPKDALSAFMILNHADQEQFAQWLTTSVEEMGKKLKEKFQMDRNIEKKLEKLWIKQQNVLFTRVFGCGKQCPFCKAPCEAGGEAHTEHFASIHRPQGLGRYRSHSSRRLVVDICSSSVFSNKDFSNLETQGFHPFKKYRDIYPDWHIPADPSIEASNYWKYVFAQFNKKFAKEYNAIDAHIPLFWKLITKAEAERSLKESFSIK